MNSKPDKLSHIKRALEIASIIFQADDYISSDRIIRIYQRKDETIEESAVKRSLKTIRHFLNQNIFESKSSKGYRLKIEYRTNREWMQSIFALYLYLTESDSLNYTIEPVTFHLDTRSLYNLYLFQYARDKQKVIEFEYIKYKESNIKTKKVEVYSILIRGRKLFILGFDIQIKDYRHYIFTQIPKVIRIHEDSFFQRPPKEELSRFYQSSLEVFEGQLPQKVLIRFLKEAEVYVKKEFFHHSQKFHYDENNFLILELNINDQDELFTMLGRFLNSAELLEPTAWKDKYIEKLKIALQMHTT
jgi:hypothetical protein